MPQDSDNSNAERVLRLLQARLNSHAWSIDRAKAQLENLVQAAKDGQPQLIGLDELVILVNMETLSHVLLDLQQPENWGEYFATAYDGSEGNVDIPVTRFGGRATYTLDTRAEDAGNDKKHKPEEEF
jgi:hypothetical protein